MNDGAALLRAILLHPAEDVPRLVYADWLDENSQPERAEFIRLQILLHNTPFVRAEPDAKWPEPWVSRIRRDHELADRCGAEWAGAARRLFPKMPPYMLRKWYTRGFLSTVRGPIKGFLSLAGDIFRESPVTRVSLGVSPYRQEIARGNWLWRRGDVSRDASSLPPAVFDLLPERGARYGYHYASDAHEALSDVLVAFGREAAGLPPLTK